MRRAWRGEENETAGVLVYLLAAGLALMLVIQFAVFHSVVLLDEWRYKRGTVAARKATASAKYKRLVDACPWVITVSTAVVSQSTSTFNGWTVLYSVGVGEENE